MEISQHILRGSMDAIRIPKLDLYSCISAGWSDNLDKVALIHGEDESYKLTYAQLSDVISRVSRDFSRAGLARNDVLSIWCSNSAPLPIASLAAWKLGSVVSLVGASLTADEAWFLIKKVDTALLLVDSSTKVKASKFIPDLQNKIVFSVDGCDVISLSDIVSRANTLNSATQYNNNTPVDLESTAMILFSSGTTGLPKAVELSHRSLVLAFVTTSEPPFGKPLKGNIVHFLPLSHFYGMFIMFRILKSSSTAILLKRFDLNTYLSLISKYQAVVMYLVPAVAVMLVKNPDLLKTYDLSRVVVAVSGGSSLPPEIGNQLEKIFAPYSVNFFVGQSYGMTETTGGFARLPVDYKPSDIPPTTVGMIVPLMELKVIDQDTGVILPMGGVGEICVRGPLLMNGYRGDPESTAKTIDKQGWLHTGDIGHYDSKGFIYLVDRAKELIKHKGMQVAPAELEDIILSHPDVEDAAVVGQPDEHAEEKPVAFVVRRAGSKVSEAEVMKHVADKVAAYKQLTGGVRFIDSIPRVPSGKIMRRVLKESLNRAKL